jgi:hypothetical protein
MWEEDARAKEERYFEREALRQKLGAGSSFGANTSFGPSSALEANTSFGTNTNTNTSFGANTSFGTNNTLEASSPRPRSIDQQLSRPDTPRSEAASTIAGEQLFSPRSSVFPTPRPRNNIFRGIPREKNSTGSSSDDSDDSDDTADGRRLSTFGRNRGSLTPTPLKRKRPGAEKETAIEIPDADSDDAMEPAEVPDKAERSHRQPPQSQRSQLSSGSNLATPSKRRTRAGLISLPTPETRGSFSGASDRSAKRCKNAPGQSTPTPARNRDALLTAPGGLSQGDDGSHDSYDADITNAVLGLLEAEPVSETVRRVVRKTLNLHAARTHGVEADRNMLRESVKTKDRTIAELRTKLVELDHRKRVDVFRQAAEDLEGLYGKDGVETRESRLLEGS